jgi:23S rRNA (adenine2030-N6)-methyltransferase
MNYRHAYHAGNFADVMKHAILALVIDYLKRKEAPFLVLDTHAGIGTYDLNGIEAQKTGEWRNGIGKVLSESDFPAELTPYLECVRSLNPAGAMTRYPGSPSLAAMLTRPQDRLALVELHPADLGTLKRTTVNDARAGIHHMDGYEALKALLPPPERRGLVLIDPPFEVKDELERLRRGLTRALKRWPTGLFLVWYPIKAGAQIERFHADLTMLGLPPTLAAEIHLHPQPEATGLIGSGLAIINPPWTLEKSLETLLPWLARVLAGDSGRQRLLWLVPQS